MPDYPNNECLFLETVEEKDNKLILRKINDSSEVIKGFDEVIKELTETNKVRNIILQ